MNIVVAQSATILNFFLRKIKVMLIGRNVKQCPSLNIFDGVKKRARNGIIVKGRNVESCQLLMQSRG